MIHVHCRGCGAFDIAGPGHPAVTCAHEDGTACGDAGPGQHVLTDRAALRHSHADGCEPHPETGRYPLAFTFMAGTAPVTLAGGGA